MNISEEEGHGLNDQTRTDAMPVPAAEPVSGTAGQTASVRESGARLSEKIANERSQPVMNGLDLRARLAAFSDIVERKADYPSNAVVLGMIEPFTPDYATTPAAPEKKKEDPCCGDGAAGGSSSGNNSVDFSLNFGRFPGIPGLSPGKLSLYSNLLQMEFLENPGALKFEHIICRRCSSFSSDTGKPEDMKEVCVLTERGYPRFTQFSGVKPEGESFSRSLSKPEKLRKRTIYTGELPGLSELGGTFLEEVLEDSTTLLYLPDTGKMAAIKTKNGIWVSKARLEEDLMVTEYNLYAGDAPAPVGVMPNDPGLRVGRRGTYIRQIWSRTDGLLDMAYNRLDPGVHPYTLRWYAPEAVGSYDPVTKLYAIQSGAQPLKEWVFSPMTWDSRLSSGPDTQVWPPEYIELHPGVWPLYDSLDSRPFDQRRKFWPYDLTYLKSFTITESRDGEQAQSLWEMPNSTAELIFRKGDVVIRKTRYGHEAPTEEEIRNSYAGPDRDFLEANNSYAKSIIETTYVNGTETESSIHARYGFGDVCTYKSFGSGDARRSITYEYEFDQHSPSYGCLMAEYHSDGNYALREYDDQKREVCRTEPWAGGGEKVTRTTFMDSWYDDAFNNQRPDFVAEFIRINGEETMVSQVEYEYNDSEYSKYERVRRTALGFSGVEYPHNPLTEMSDTQWYGPCYVTEGQWSPRAVGQLAYMFAPDGSQEWYEYGDCNESYLSHRLVHRRIKTTRFNGELVPGQSEKVEYYYNDLDELQMEKRYVMTDEGFIQVGWLARRFDVAHRVVFEESTTGAYSETSWKCQGPALQSLETGQTIAYEYDAAGRLVRKTESALQINNDGSMDPSWVSNLTLPAVVTEYGYDAYGNKSVERVTMGDSVSETRKEWDVLGRPVREIDAAGLVTSYTYSPDGLVTTVMEPTGATFITRRHQDGSILSEEGTGQQARFFSYGICSEGLIARVRLNGPSGPVVEETLTDGLGHVRCVNVPGGDGNILTSVAWYDEVGRVVCSQTGDMAHVCMEYGAMGSAVRRSTIYSNGTQRPDRIEESSSRYVSMALAPLAGQKLVWRETIRSIYFGSNDESPILEKSYDLISETTELRAARMLIDRYGRENAAWVKQLGEKTVTYQSLAEATGLSFTVSMNGWHFYSKGNLKDGEFTWYSFEAEGISRTDRDGSGAYTTVRHDRAGRPVSLTRDILGTRTWAYDSMTGLLSSETNFRDVGTTRYAYDVRGREIARFGDGCHPMTFTYDEADRMTSMTTFRAPNETITENPSNRSDGDRTQWVYDPMTGLTLKKIMADGSAITKNYDAYGRPVRISSARGLQKAFYWNKTTGNLEAIGYNDGTPSITYAYDDRGLVRSVTDGAGTRTWEYTPQLNPSREHFEGQYTYDLYIKRDEFGKPLREFLDIGGKSYQTSCYHYDSMSGRSQSIGDDRDSNFFLYYDRYNGKLSSTGGDSLLKMVNEYDYSTDTLYKRKYLRSDNNEEIARLETGFWGVGGQLTYKKDILNGQPRKEREYKYNPRGELTEELIGQGRRRTYTYDNIGNRLEETGAEDAYCRRYTCNRGLNQYDRCEVLNGQGAVLQSLDISWDLDGNQLTVPTEKGVWQTVWNAENRPVCFSRDGIRVECQYDYMGRRVTQTVVDATGNETGRHYVYSGYRLVAELDAELILSQTGQEAVYKTWVWDGNSIPGISKPILMKVWATPYPMETGYPDTGYSDDTGYPMETGYSDTGSSRTSASSEGNAEAVGKTFLGKVAIASQNRQEYPAFESVPTMYPTHSVQTKYALFALLESPYPEFEYIPTEYPHTEYPGEAVPSETVCLTYAYLHDANNNVMGLVDTEGRLVESYEYDAYGRCRHLMTSGADNPLLWSSEYYDKTLGLVFYNYRCYNPLDGRWISRDPIGEEGGANLYCFVGNDPVNKVDLLGLSNNTQVSNIKDIMIPDKFKGEKLYDTLDDARVNAGELVNSISEQLPKTKCGYHPEVAVNICCKKGKFYLSKPSTSMDSGRVYPFNMQKCNDGDSAVEFVHNHPNGSIMSSADKSAAINGIINITPAGTPVTSCIKMEKKRKPAKEKGALPGTPVKEKGTLPGTPLVNDNYTVLQFSTFNPSDPRNKSNATKNTIRNAAKNEKDTYAGHVDVRSYSNETGNWSLL